MSKKNIIVVALIFAFAPLMYAQSFIPRGPYRSIIGNIKTTEKTEKKSKGHHTIMPFIGFENFLFANAGSLGSDFKYTRSSGFALYGNVGFVFGSSTTKVKSTIFSLSLEALLGYSKTVAAKHTIAFALGLQGAYGLGVMEYIAATFRLEYSYLITQKYGIHFCFTDGVGITKEQVRSSFR